MARFLTETVTSQLTIFMSNALFFAFLAVAAADTGSGISAAGTLTSMPPAAPTLRTPANSASGLALKVSLSWRNTLHTSGYEWQVSLRSDFSPILFTASSLADTTAWLESLTNNTTYYWRVAAVNVAGKSSYSAVWSFTTIIAAPAMPVLTAPADGAVEVAVVNTLAWTAAERAAGYHVQVSTKADFSSRVVDQDNVVETTQAVSGLAHATRYYWRVRAKNAGGASAFTAPRSFTTIMAIPAVPVLNSPADGAGHVLLSGNLSWLSAERAAYYHLQLSSKADFSVLLIDKADITETTFVANGLSHDTPYYWRVRSRNSAGFSAFSAARSFTTIIAAPKSPSLATPADGARDVAVHVVLTWSVAERATAYQVQVATKQDFSELFLDRENIVESSVSVTNLTHNATYYWRVRAKNVGGVSSFTGARSFTTIVAAPLLPALVAPANGAQDVAVNVALTWTPAEGATAYQVQVSSKSDFATLLVDTETAETSFAPAALQHLTLYYWRVRAKNSGGTTEFTAGRSFQTIIAVPSIPLAISPPDGGKDQPLPVVLTWAPADRAGDYHVQVAADSQFSQLIFDKTTTDTSCIVNGLQHQAIYYWRIAAGNAGGSGGYSRVRSFATIMAVPAAPALLEPVSGAKITGRTGRLVWRSTPAAVDYHIQVSTTTDFSTLFKEQSALPDTAWIIGELEYHQLYYWRVRAANQGGFGAYSETGSFSAEMALPDVPQLVAPGDGTTGVTRRLSLWWTRSPQAACYHVQVSRNVDFSALILDQPDLADTVVVISELDFSTVYYWRVCAVNPSGSGLFSAIWNFTTIIAPPPPPQLLYPPNGKTSAPLEMICSWSAVESANSYQLQISKQLDFSTIAQEHGELTEATCTVSGLELYTDYFWRVRAINSGGAGEFSAVFRFKTGATEVSMHSLTELPSHFMLWPNFPNPFNPETTITFAVPANRIEQVTIVVYNNRGQMVRCLVHGLVAEGIHSVKWDGHNQYGEPVGSGVYVCRLQAADQVQTIKMIYVR